MSKPKGMKQDPTNNPCELVQTLLEAAEVLLVAALVWSNVLGSLLP